jgi:hypothetical protein
VPLQAREEGALGLARNDDGGDSIGQNGSRRDVEVKKRKKERKVDEAVSQTAFKLTGGKYRGKYIEKTGGKDDRMRDECRGPLRNRLLFQQYCLRVK